MTCILYREHKTNRLILQCLPSFHDEMQRTVTILCTMNLYQDLFFNVKQCILVEYSCLMDCTPQRMQRSFSLEINFQLWRMESWLRFRVSYALMSPSGQKDTVKCNVQLENLNTKLIETANLQEIDQQSVAAAKDIQVNRYNKVYQ